jgi:hypothetical protein
MAGVFINYRRGDDSALAGRLYDRLSARFGKDRVFLDVDGVQPGTRFLDVIHLHIERCDALVAVIGRHWLSATRHDGARRLDDPSDYVKAEIREAMAQGKHIVPVLAHDAPMPRPEQLPLELVGLADIHALRLSEQDFDDNVDTLIASLATVVREPIAPTAKEPPIVLPRGETAPSPGVSTLRSLLPSKRLKSLLIPAAIAIVIGSGALLFGQRNLIINGDFENPPIGAKSFRVVKALEGWRVDPLAEVEIQRNFNDEGKAKHGEQHVELDGYRNSTISQTAATEPDGRYILSFWYSPRPGQPEQTNGVEVRFNDRIIATLSREGAGNTSWQRFRYEVTASGKSSTITFRGIGTSDGVGGLLDSVSLVRKTWFTS